MSNFLYLCWLVSVLALITIVIKFFEKSSKIELAKLELKELTDDCLDLIQTIKSNFKGKFFVVDMETYTKRVNNIREIKTDDKNAINTRINSARKLRIFLDRILKKPEVFFDKKYYDVFDDSLLTDPVELVVGTTTGPIVVEVNRDNAKKFEESGPPAFFKKNAGNESQHSYRIKNINDELFYEDSGMLLLSLILSSDGEIIAEQLEPSKEVGMVNTTEGEVESDDLGFAKEPVVKMDSSTDDSFKTDDSDA